MLMMLTLIRKRYTLEDLGVDCRDNINMDLTDIGWRVWLGLIWRRIWANGGMLWVP